MVKDVELHLREPQSLLFYTVHTKSLRKIKFMYMITVYTVSDKWPMKNLTGQSFNVNQSTDRDRIG